jgi:hypothetical protein
LFSFITFILEDEHWLSLGILRHAKFMHELCSLLLHIPTYLNVMRCYNHVFALILGIFQTIPSLLILTLCGRKCFFSVLTFQELWESKRGKVKEHGLEISRQTRCAEVGHHHINGIQMIPGGVASLPDCATCTRLRFECPMLSIFMWFS